MNQYTIEQELIEALELVVLWGDIYNERGMFCRGCNKPIIQDGGGYKTDHRLRCPVAKAEKRLKELKGEK